MGYGWWRPAASRMQPLQDMQIRDDPKRGLQDVRSFVGACNFSRRHLHNFTYSSAPLDSMHEVAPPYLPPYLPPPLPPYPHPYPPQPPLLPPQPPLPPLPPPNPPLLPPNPPYPPLPPPYPPPYLPPLLPPPYLPPLPLPRFARQTDRFARRGGQPPHPP